LFVASKDYVVYYYYKIHETHTQRERERGGDTPSKYGAGTHTIGCGPVKKYNMAKNRLNCR